MLARLVATDAVASRASLFGERHAADDLAEALLVAGLLLVVVVVSPPALVELGLDEKRVVRAQLVLVGLAQLEGGVVERGAHRHVHVVGGYVERERVTVLEHLAARLEAEELAQLEQRKDALLVVLVG